MNQEQKMPRRSFMDFLLKGGLVVWVVGFITPVITYIWPVQKRGPSLQTVSAGNASDIPEWSTKMVAVEGQPVMVIHTPQGFRAFSAICTHLGCVVVWDLQRKQIACPCHAGFFDTNGKVISGPPPKELPEYGVAVVNNEVLVKSA